MSHALWAVIPAGGAGTRLWPLSRSGRPKFLLDLTGTGSSLLQATVARLAPITHGRTMVVTGTPHRAAVLEQLPGVPADRVLAEPSPRDSMAAIGWAAALLERREPDAVMGSFAADHVIARDDEFASVVRTAARAAAEGWLVTIGIGPTAPATGFGYIRVGEPLPGLDGTYRAAEFVEKPSAEVAAGYLADGGYRWNAGMFLARPSVILDLLAVEHPAFAAALRTLAAEPDRLPEIWEALPRIAFDHAVAEPAAAAGRVAVVPGDFGWDDVGDVAGLSELLGDGDQEGLVCLGDDSSVLAEDSTGLVVPGSGRVVALIGVRDIAVVDTGDALLVTSLERAQEVKEIVARLRETGRAELT